jgi:hypothetical protein
MGAMAPHDPDPITLAEVVHRACSIVDPDDHDAAIGDFERYFEDSDEPVRALDDIESRVATALGELDPATNNGSLSMAAAVTVYLSFRRDEFAMEPAKLLRMAAEDEWKGTPPEVVVEFLADRGITL